jgi:hypothetical protein
LSFCTLMERKQHSKNKSSYTYHPRVKYALAPCVASSDLAFSIV